MVNYEGKNTKIWCVNEVDSINTFIYTIILIINEAKKITPSGYILATDGNWFVDKSKRRQNLSHNRSLLTRSLHRHPSYNSTKLILITLPL